MTRRRLPEIEIETLAQFDAMLAHTTHLHNWTLRSLDLTQRSRQLAAVDPAGGLFLGCTFDDADEDALRERGALIFPALPTLPFDAYRPRLYQAAELYDAVARGDVYSECTDAAVYAWFRGHGPRPGVPATLAMSLHDHAISDALDDLCATIDPAMAVGIMGGHALQRGNDDYVGAARLGSQLSLAGRTVMTGGGPGAMEAANLGARLAGQYGVLGDAIQRLAAAPTFAEDITYWAQTALDVLQNTRATGTSIGIPTWFYGHEPPHVFATGIAEYFSNALREDTLLERCAGGLIYLPGAAGTVQEVFQAATRNYYAPEGTNLAPMILVGVHHWTGELPVWPLLDRLAQGRPMEHGIHLVETVDDAAEVLLGS